MRAAAVATAAAALIGAGQSPSWPSPAQVELVRARRAMLDPGRFVESIDQREPLEVVPGSSSPRRLPAAKPSKARATALAAALAYAAEQRSYALIVWRDGRVELEHYWAGHDAGTRSDTASMTKAVTALLVGAAVADGHIGGVDDQLGRYLPETRGTPRGALTLRALLEMASGIETPPTSDDPASAYWQSALGDDLRASIARWPQPRQPFERFYYANANTQYLGWVIEAATRQRYAAYLSRRLWAPLGAHEARVWLDRAGGSARTFCCLQARARDWLLIGRLIMDRGRIDGRQLVPGAWIDAMVAGSRRNPNFGWQIWRGSPHNPARTYGAGIPAVVPAARPFARDDVYFLDGSGGQRVYAIPSARTVVVRIGAPTRTWDDATLPNLLVER
jgi:CubicO group peptidase (beta-lactamase class C family)